MNKTIYFGWDIRRDDSAAPYMRFAATKKKITLRSSTYDTILDLIRGEENIKPGK